MSHDEMGTEPRLVRRVQAVVQVRMKEEDSDQDLFDHDKNSTFSSPSAYLSSMESTGTPSPSQRTRRRVKKTRKVIRSDDDKDYEGEDGAGVNSDINSEEEDDELMMGTEDNRRELYGAERVVPKIIPNGYNSTTRGLAPNRKRKVDPLAGRTKVFNKIRRL